MKTRAGGGRVDCGRGGRGRGEGGRRGWGGVNLVVLPTPEAACQRAAELVAELVTAKPASCWRCRRATRRVPCTPNWRAGTAPSGCRSRARPRSASMNTSASGREHAAVVSALMLRDQLYHHVDLPPRACTRPMAPPSTWALPLRATSTIAAAGGFDLGCSASVATATSPSTNRGRRSRRARASCAGRRPAPRTLAPLRRREWYPRTR